MQNEDVAMMKCGVHYCGGQALQHTTYSSFASRNKTNKEYDLWCNLRRK